MNRTLLVEEGDDEGDNRQDKKKKEKEKLPDTAGTHGQDFLILAGVPNGIF